MADLLWRWQPLLTWAAVGTGDTTTVIKTDAVSQNVYRAKAKRVSWFKLKKGIEILCSSLFTVYLIIGYFLIIRRIFHCRSFASCCVVFVLLFVLYELEIHNQLILSDLWTLGFTIPILPRLTLPTAIHSGLVFVKPRFWFFQSEKTLCRHQHSEVIRM